MKNSYINKKGTVLLKNGGGSYNEITLKDKMQQEYDELNLKYNGSRLRVIELEDAIEQAQHTILFIHNCLIDPTMYKYHYPNQTINFQKELKELYRPLKGCAHSIRKPKECESCNHRIERDKLKKSLKELIESSKF